MESLDEVIKKRKIPGVLIFDAEGNVVYLNDEALDIISDLKKTARSVKTRAHDIPEEIYAFYKKVRTKNKASRPVDPDYGVLKSGSGRSYAVRAFPIGGGKDANPPTHILVLIEGVVEKHVIDVTTASKDFNLTRKEQEVLRLLCQGLSNKGISENLFISEYTVKGHVRNIMAKMTVSSRTELIASLSA